MSDLNSEDAVPKLTKVERLELAGYIAPALRRATEKAKSRPVKFYNQETGDITKHATHEEALKGLAKIYELEHTVQDGVRPRAVLCKFCGCPVQVPANGGGIPESCRGGCVKCAHEGCDRLAPKSAFEPSKVKRRHGKPWKCAEHFQTLEQRRANGKKAQSKLTPEERSEKARRATSPEQRIANGKKAQSKLTEEERKERGARAGKACKGIPKKLISETQDERRQRCRSNLSKAWEISRAEAKDTAA